LQSRRSSDRTSAAYDGCCERALLVLLQLPHTAICKTWLPASTARICCHAAAAVRCCSAAAGAAVLLLLQFAAAALLLLLLQFAFMLLLPVLTVNV
jgi:hypothetical protein